MIKNLINKIGDNPAGKEKTEVSPEIMELRKKFHELDNKPVNDKPPFKIAENNTQADNSQGQSGANIEKKPGNENNPDNKSNPGSEHSQTPNQVETPSIQETVELTKPSSSGSGVKLVDVEQAQSDERMTNMIMEQIKELIEIDNNLNEKIKLIETNVDQTRNDSEKFGKQLERFQASFETIEKNMEKFMALYEVVTNQYNPFVEQSGTLSEKDGSTKGEKYETDNKSSDKKEDKADGGKKAVANFQVDEQYKDVKDKADDPGPADETKKTPGKEINQSGQVSESQQAEGSGNTSGDNPEKAEEPHEDQQKPQGESAKPGSMSLNIGGLSKEEESKYIEDIKKKIEQNKVQTTVSEIPESTDKDIHKIINQKMADMHSDFLKSVQGHISTNIEVKLKELYLQLEQAINQQISSMLTEKMDVSSEKIKEEVNKKFDESKSRIGELFNLEAGKIKEIPPEHFFYLSNGHEVKNLQELKSAMQWMNSEIFESHVNEQKNDFADWIKIVFKDETLAAELTGKTKDEMISVIESKIK